MTIKPLGFLQYEVTGQSGVYICDLEEGKCSCPDWNCRVWPKLRDNLIDKSKADCKHTRQAKIYAFDELKPLLVKHWNKQL